LLARENELWQIDQYFDCLPKNIRGSVKKLFSSAAFLKEPFGEHDATAYDCLQLISKYPKTDFRQKQIDFMRSTSDSDDWTNESFSKFPQTAIEILLFLIGAYRVEDLEVHLIF